MAVAQQYQYHHQYMAMGQAAPYGLRYGAAYHAGPWAARTAEVTAPAAPLAAPTGAGDGPWPPVHAMGAPTAFAAAALPADAAAAAAEPSDGEGSDGESFIDSCSTDSGWTPTASAADVYEVEGQDNEAAGRGVAPSSPTLLSPRSPSLSPAPPSPRSRSPSPEVAPTEETEATRKAARAAFQRLLATTPSIVATTRWAEAELALGEAPELHAVEDVRDVFEDFVAELGKKAAVAEAGKRDTAEQRYRDLLAEHYHRPDHSGMMWVEAQRDLKKHIAYKGLGDGDRERIFDEHMASLHAKLPEDERKAAGLDDDTGGDSDSSDSDSGMEHMIIPGAGNGATATRGPWEKEETVDARRKRPRSPPTGDGQLPGRFIG